MYVFKEFNQIHSDEIRASLIAYFGLLAISGALSLYLSQDLFIALVATIIAWLCVHVLRLRRLAQRHEINLSPVQLWATLVFAIVAAMLLLFAIWYAKQNQQDLSWRTCRSIFLSLGLATYLTVYVDFAIAFLIRRLT